MKRRPLTSQEVTWKDNLKRLYKNKKDELDLTQEKLAHLCGWKTQASVSNYMNGVIPLNTEANLKLSKVLGVDVREIDPDFEYSAALESSFEDIFEKHKGWFDSLPRETQQEVMIELAQRIKSKDQGASS